MKLLFGKEIWRIEETYDENDPNHSDNTHLLLRNHADTSVVMMTDNNEEGMGWMVMHPLTNEAYEAIKNDTYDDIERFPEKDIIKLENVVGECSLFIVSYFIGENYRTTSNIKILIEAYKTILKKITEMGIVVRRVMGDCGSIEGERLATIVGLSYVCDTRRESKIYEWVNNKNRD